MTEQVSLVGETVLTNNLSNINFIPELTDLLPMLLIVPTAFILDDEIIQFDDLIMEPAVSSQVTTTCPKASSATVDEAVNSVNAVDDINSVNHVLNVLAIPDVNAV